MAVETSSKYGGSNMSFMSIILVVEGISIVVVVEDSQSSSDIVPASFSLSLQNWPRSTRQ